MTRFQEEAIIAINAGESQVEFEKLAEALFKALNINNIGFKPLAIPVADLDLEAVMPLRLTNSAVINSVDIAKFIRSSILFDLYIPSKKWVMNLANANQSNNYLDDAISKSVTAAMRHIIIGPDCLMSDVPLSDAPYFGLEALLCDAVKAYLNARGITHPLDSISALRDGKHRSDCLFTEAQIDKIIQQVLK